MESVAFGVIGILAVLACAVSAFALRFAQPDVILTLRSQSRALQDELAHLRDVELVQVAGRAEALLDRAELRFDEAERRRKSTSAREQRLGQREATEQPTADQVMAHPEATRADKLRAMRSLRAQRG